MVLKSTRYEVIFDVPEKKIRLEELDHRLLDPEIWRDPAGLKAIQSERSGIAETLTLFNRICGLYDDLGVMLDLAGDMDGDDDQGIDDDIKAILADLNTLIKAVEKTHMLSGKDDEFSAFVEIHAGAGGLEAQDWAEMLLRMYLRWADQNGFEARIMDIASDEEAGIKGATIEIEGKWAFGYLKCESGVHRLVRISPYDSNNRRHTSFASIMVTPEVEQSIDIQIDDKDLRIDTYRASGHGGQHVNKTDSAVRITHLPTGIVVQCQNERSQHKNKAYAMKVLASKLYEREEDQLRQEQDAANSLKKEIAWGSQIRSYILHPYRMAKDHRTGLDVGNVDAVLDGDLNAFIDACLMQQTSGK